MKTPLWIVVVLLCAGCAATVGGPAGTYASPSAIFSKVVPGKTTKNEVLAMLGPPLRAHQYRAEQYETWEYSYYSDYFEERTFWIQFRPDGMVASTEDTKDFYAYPYRFR